MGPQEHGDDLGAGAKAPMDRWLGQTLSLLAVDDSELKRAAAAVLGALKPNNGGVVAALGKALADPDPRLRRLCLDAIAGIGGTDAFEPVAGLLGEEGEVGRLAVDVLTGMGPAVLGKLKRRIDRATPLARRRILAVATHLGGANGIALILRALESGHAQQVLELGERLAGRLAQTKARDRTHLVSKIESFLDSAAAREDSEAAVAAVDFLARILGGEAGPRLLDYATSKRTPAVRRRALEALARETADRPLSPDHVVRLLALLQDPDYTNIVAPAMSVLERAKLTAANGPPIFALLHGTDPALRRFAVGALGQLDTPKSAEALLAVIAGDNPDLQKRAAVALTNLSAAVAPAVAALASASDAQTAWILARILLPRAHQMKPDQGTTLGVAAAKWLEPGDPRAEAVLSVLRGRHLDALRVAAEARLRKLKRARKSGEILNLMRPLVREEGETPAEVRYEVALAEVVRGPKDVVREARLNHPGLFELELLAADPAFDLLARLRKEKGYLLAEDYYLVGSHFAERPYADRVLGGELLRWLVKTFPEDLSTQGAGNKLLMEGFAPPPAPKQKRPKAARRPPRPPKPAVKAAKRKPAKRPPPRKGKK